MCPAQFVFCDPDRLRGILLNLYTNAAKFTKRGHIVLRARSVSRDYTPPAPAGYSAIMLQPSYHPSSSSHR
jgi:signal transduction histidine kinase